jgi:hypothetical protein
MADEQRRLACGCLAPVDIEHPGSFVFKSHDVDGHRVVWIVDWADTAARRSMHRRRGCRTIHYAPVRRVSAVCDACGREQGRAECDQCDIDPTRGQQIFIDFEQPQSH